MNPSLGMMPAVLATAFLCATLVPLGAQVDVEIPTFKRPAGPDGNLELQIRDLQALTAEINGVPPAGLLVDPGRGRMESTAQVLAKAVRAFVDPPITRDDDVQLVGGRYLVSVGRAAQQAWIDRFLRGQLELAGDQIMVFMQVFVVDPETVEDLGLDEGPQSLDAEASKGLLQKLDTADGVEKQASPRVLILPLTQWTASTGRQISYVRDIEVAVDEAGNTTVDPIVDQVFAGIQSSCETMRLSESEIGLLGTVEIAEVREPFPVAELHVGPGTRKMEIQVPSVTRLAVDLNLAIQGDGSAVVAGPPLKGRRTLVVAQAGPR